MPASTLSSGQLTPRMMVLGLVIQQEDTVAGVARRLADQFASARFPPNSAHKNLPSLASKGYVRLVEKGPPNEPTRDRYERTPTGVEFFRGWLRHTELPPAIRDAVQCKLEFLEREDLAALVKIVREEEDACRRACNAAHGRVVTEQSSRLAQKKRADYNLRLRGIQSKDEAMLWSLMSKRLEHLREELEELLDEISADSPDHG
jgi:DNA-binding PadR family transcriptional regulator